MVRNGRPRIDTLGHEFMGEVGAIRVVDGRESQMAVVALTRGSPCCDSCCAQWCRGGAFGGSANCGPAENRAVAIVHKSAGR